MSGTSMASPHVAGAVALHIAATVKPGDAYDVANIRQTLITDAQDQADWNPDGTGDPDGMAEGMVYVGVGGGSVQLDLDIAVTSVSAPASVILKEVSDTVTVTVHVQNNGANNEPFNVTLADDLGSTVGAAQNVMLESGDGVDLEFDWTPTETGSHTLTAFHDLDDDNRLNDDKSTVVEVSPEPVVGAIAVSSYCYSGQGGKNADKHFVVAVTITSNGDLMSGGTVNVTISDGFSSRSGAGTTDDNGDVAFNWKAANTGRTYTTTVVSVNGDADIANDTYAASWSGGGAVCSP